MRRSTLRRSLLSAPIHISTQRGSGILSTANSIIHNGKLALDLYDSELGNRLRNSLPDSDGLARPGFAGESHQILKLPNGKPGLANYSGQSGLGQ